MADLCGRHAVVNVPAYDGQPLCEIVKLQRKNGAVVQDCEVYIGRACYRGGWELPQSKWHNPFSVNGEKKANFTISDSQARTVVCTKYYHHIKQSQLKTQLCELRGRVLGCWCPLDYNRDVMTRINDPQCHGEVLMRLLAEETAGLL